MSDIYQHVGERIRFYRKREKMTISRLAELIHRSKSTVSKYEQGSIAMDLETAKDIADALNVSLLQILDYGIEPTRKRPAPRAKTGSFADGPLYTYCLYGKRDLSIAAGYIVRAPDPLNGPDRAIFYDKIRSLEHYANCEDMYVGVIYSFDTLIRLELEHIGNSMARCVISALNPFAPNEPTVGLRSDVSEIPIMPVALKIVLSSVPITDEARLLSMLNISNEEIKNIKRTGYLYLNSQL